MSQTTRAVRPEPFFLPAPGGQRFCLFYPTQGAPRAALVYVHPFAEEMNKARRVAALQSSAFAAAGCAVLQIDLVGCGDSSGDFGDANWESWVEDVVLAARWLGARTGTSVGLWGLRLGGLLALAAAPHCDVPPGRFVLWQPMLSGDMQLTQFLRLRLAAEMMQDGGGAKSGGQALRSELAAGKSLEIGGYLLAPRLALPMANLKLVDLKPVGAVHWFEVVAEPGRDLSPAANRVAKSWREGGVNLDVKCVSGPSFWNTVEIAECPALIAASTGIFGETRQ